MFIYVTALAITIFIIFGLSYAKSLFQNSRNPEVHLSRQVLTTLPREVPSNTDGCNTYKINEISMNDAAFHQSVSSLDKKDLRENMKYRKDVFLSNIKKTGVNSLKEHINWNDLYTYSIENNMHQLIKGKDLTESAAVETVWSTNTQDANVCDDNQTTTVGTNILQAYNDTLQACDISSKKMNGNSTQDSSLSKTSKQNIEHAIVEDNENQHDKTSSLM